MSVGSDGMDAASIASSAGREELNSVLAELAAKKAELVHMKREKEEQLKREEEEKRKKEEEDRLKEQLRLQKELTEGMARLEVQQAALEEQKRALADMIRHQQAEAAKQKLREETAERMRREEKQRLAAAAQEAQAVIDRAARAAAEAERKAQEAAKAEMDRQAAAKRAAAEADRLQRERDAAQAAERKRRDEAEQRNKPRYLNLEYGNTHEASCDSCNPHKWNFYIKVTGDNADWTKEICKVTIYLHESFRRNTFDLQRTSWGFQTGHICGWGTFEVKAVVHYTDGDTTTLKWCLDFCNCGSHDTCRIKL